MLALQPYVKAIVDNTDDLPALIQLALEGKLGEEQAKELASADPSLLALALLAASHRIAELNAKNSATDPSTPSAMIPVYKKKNTQKKRRRKPGAKKGHSGERRLPSLSIDKRVVCDPLKQCPECGERVLAATKSRKRIVEDIPEDLKPQTTEYEIPRQWCSNCKKRVEPVVTAALPKSTLGNNVLALSAWLHYGLGVTIDQVIALLQHHLQTRLSRGGLVAMWQRLAMILDPWHQEIGLQVKNSSYLHADETGWRVDGKTHWLWCFANPQACYYMIDASRGSPALNKFFTQSFEGILITDFWGAYNSVMADERQYCMVHLLRELEKVKDANTSEHWQCFYKKLRRILRDGLRLRCQPDYSPELYESRINLLNKRLIDLTKENYKDSDAKRLIKRLKRCHGGIFTFLDYPQISADNNFAERQIRPAVILRKNSQCNRSEVGAATQAVLMSVFQTIKLRQISPTKTIIKALESYVQTGNLGEIPAKTVALE